jgi:hypothetical protein
VNRSARISDCGLYRYALARDWADLFTERTRPLLFVGLNPSTADAWKEDATVRRLISFAKRQGCTSVEIVNLFAYRTPEPRDLQDAAEAGIDVIGPLNDTAILSAIERSNNIVIAAWGASGPKGLRALRISQFRKLVDQPLWCLGTTSDGSPRHPLYVSTVDPLKGSPHASRPDLDRLRPGPRVSPGRDPAGRRRRRRFRVTG